MAIDWTKIYKKYKGKWIALREDEKTVITWGQTVKEVMDKSKKKGFNLPILTRIPETISLIVGLINLHEIKI